MKKYGVVKICDKCNLPMKQVSDTRFVCKKCGRAKLISEDERKEEENE